MNANNLLKYCYFYKYILKARVRDRKHEFSRRANNTNGEPSTKYFSRHVPCFDL